MKKEYSKLKDRLEQLTVCRMSGKAELGLVNLKTCFTMASLDVFGYLNVQRIENNANYH